MGCSLWGIGRTCGGLGEGPEALGASPRTTLGGTSMTIGGGQVIGEDRSVGLEMLELGPGPVCRITGSTPPKRGLGGGPLGPGTTRRIPGSSGRGPEPPGG